MPFMMIRDDIVNVRADALVNPANETLSQGSGTSRAIYLAAGEEKLTKACQEIGRCSLGKAVITEAFDLDAKYIIHAVGPVWKNGLHREKKHLYSAYKEAMLLAETYHLKSVAFPLLSSGNYGYPKDKALKVAVCAIRDFLAEHDMTVYLVLYDRSAVAVSKRLFMSLKEYIDDHYVRQKDESYKREPPLLKRGLPEAQSACFHMADMPASRSLDDLMDHMGETFSQMLLRLIDERKLKDSYVYKKANVDRRHFSKIRNDTAYAPNKKTVLAFCVALELSLDETKDLLMRAGFALSDCSKSDVILRYFIENRKYDIFEINEMLFAYDQPLLGS